MNKVKIVAAVERERERESYSLENKTKIFNKKNIKIGVLCSYKDTG